MPRDPQEPARSRPAQAERRNRIREQVARQGHVLIAELAEALGVSIMTIHRDLDALSGDGWLVKVRGGARLARPFAEAGRPPWRAESDNPAKRAVARQALAHITPGQVIFLDESTTSIAMTAGLAARAPLTVISNSVRNIMQLSRHPLIELISIGGTYDRKYQAFFGMMAIEMIHRLRADTLFLSTTALCDGVCYCRSAESLLLKRALMGASARKVLLVDHAKLATRALYELAPVTDFDLIICDDGAPEEEIAALRDAGVAVELAALAPVEGVSPGNGDA